MTDIKIRSLTGASIKTYIPSIVKIHAEVLKEFPYLRLSDSEEDIRYLKRLSQSKDAIAILVFDGPKIVGVSTGCPLEKTMTPFQKPFLENDHAIADYYYFGVSALLKQYRGRGIAHHFFDLREQHVKQLKKYKKICFSTVIRNKKPHDYTPLDAFWKKRGYIEHKDLITHFSWREIDEKESSPKPLNFWIKEV